MCSAMKRCHDCRPTSQPSAPRWREMTAGRGFAIGPPVGNEPASPMPPTLTFGSTRGPPAVVVSKSTPTPSPACLVPGSIVASDRTWAEDAFIASAQAANFSTSILSFSRVFVSFCFRNRAVILSSLDCKSAGSGGIWSSQPLLFVSSSDFAPAGFPVPWMFSNQRLGVQAHRDIFMYSDVRSSKGSFALLLESVFFFTTFARLERSGTSLRPASFSSWSA
mmetsp:Transcript_34826/g.64819  ORF Transcript_34826/g.64819 Transcript_34826/m.64819 type:complete len:221 (-) Transcript_34826:153-815(-)